MGQKILNWVINTVQYMWHISFIFLKIPEMCTPLLPYYGGALQKPLAFLPLHLNSYCPEHLFNENNPKQIKPYIYIFTHVPLSQLSFFITTLSKLSLTKYL